MHALLSLVSLVALAAAAPCPAQDKSKGFTLYVHVTDKATDLAPSVEGYSLSTIHDGAGQAIAGLYTDSARVWYLNGTEAQITDNEGTVIADGGTPPFPNGIDVLAAKDGISSVRVDAGPGTPGVQLSTSPDSYTYLTAPTDGTYLACLEPVPYYGNREFLLLKHAEAGKAPPSKCAKIRLVPQCAELPELPQGALASHEFAREVGCYKAVALIPWAKYDA